MATARQGDGKAKMADTIRGPEGGTRRGNTTTSRRGEKTGCRCNKRKMRDIATISWRNKTMRGQRVYRRRNNQLVRKGGQEGGATREEERQCNNKLEQQEGERVAQQEDDKRQCNNQLTRQDDERAAQ